jgi:hypothetical protein
MTDKPPWRHKVPYLFARWVHDHPVVKIEPRWEATGADTGEYWWQLTAEDGESRRCPVMLYDGGELAFVLRGNRGVWLRQDVVESIQAVAAWEISEARDLAAYKRLKQKFDPS